MSRRTVARDVEVLKEMRAPLEYDAKRNGYCYTDRSWQMPALDLAEGELLQLLLAGRMAAQYKGTPLARTLAMLFEKIVAMLPDKVSIDPAYVGEQFSFHGLPTREISEDIWLTVVRGLRTCRVMRIGYARLEAESVGVRDVEPAHVACIGDEWYLVAHCRRRDALRHFAISRIVSAELTDEHFEPRDFDPDEYFSNRFGRYVGEPGEASKVVIRFAAPAAPWVLERCWHPRQKIKRHRDGAVTLSFSAPSLYEAKRWVLQWGAEAEVVRPRELREDIENEGRALAQLYGRRRT